MARGMKKCTQTTKTAAKATRRAGMVRHKAQHPAEVRDDVAVWFEKFGRFCDERTREAMRGRPNVLQQRMFAHYRWCLERDKPCRMVVLKYRRAGSSTASAAILYAHARNYQARLGVVGTDYKASSNMMAMVKHFGRYDEFTGWGGGGSELESAKCLVPSGQAHGDGSDGNDDEDGPSTDSGTPFGGDAADVTGSGGPWFVDGEDSADMGMVEGASLPSSLRYAETGRYARPRGASLDEDGPFEKAIATRIEWAHGSSVELYTASNPESARSAGLNGYHATECGRWAAGGQLDAGETIMSMRNALPKSGFHVAIEESTANGAQGAFYDTCRGARWPEGEGTKDEGGRMKDEGMQRVGAAKSGAVQGPLLSTAEALRDVHGAMGTINSQPSTANPWWHQWQSDFPLEAARFAPDLQFVFIFAAWFEDERHVERLTPQEAKEIEETVDGAAWYDGERELIARFGQEGPRGLRLGAEVDATVWEQLAWRRGIIAHVCTRRGLEEFKQEYPSNPLEAFRSSGSPVFDPDGLIALEEMRRQAPAPAFGNVERERSDPYCPRGGHWTGVTWRSANERAATIWRWEEPVENGRYLIAVDTKENSEIIKGSGNLDRNSVLVLRDAWQDERRVWHPVKLVARVAAPNQWDDAPLARLIAPLAKYYGDCLIVVENNKGLALITRLRDEHGCQLYCSEHWDAVKQTTAKTYGWRTDEGSRRQMVSTGQEYIRDKRLELLDAHAIAELKSFVFNSQGKATAASGTHDDDVIALLMGLCCLHAAILYPRVRARVPAAAKTALHDVWAEGWPGVDFPHPYYT
jgi:hypothetical protein